ncbi:subtilisin-like serine protease [Ceratobasidium sp. 414]|nr:subtilisin-like serine protease [Ceratobasidium sp. 414]
MVLKRVAISLTALLFIFSLGLVAASTDEIYIVALKPGANLGKHTTERRDGFELKYTYDSVLHGYAAALSPPALAALKASDEVQSIERDQILSIQEAKRVLDPGPQTGASVTHRLAKKAAGGAGVDIYILDTGSVAHSACGWPLSMKLAIRYSRHPAMFWRTSHLGTQMQTEMGIHGTAIAASALCASTGGTATSAIGIAVKVLSDAGSGTVSDIIYGVNWVVTQFKATGRPSIAVMAIGGGISTSMDNVVAAAVASGVHVVVTAGFSARDVSTGSPARVATAVTVGSLPRSKAFPSNRYENMGEFRYCRY